MYFKLLNLLFVRHMLDCQIVRQFACFHLFVLVLVLLLPFLCSYWTFLLQARNSNRFHNAFGTANWLCNYFELILIGFNGCIGADRSTVLCSISTAACAQQRHLRNWGRQSKFNFSSSMCLIFGLTDFLSACGFLATLSVPQAALVVTIIFPFFNRHQRRADEF